MLTQIAGEAISGRFTGEVEGDCFSQTASKGEQDASSKTHGLGLGPLSAMEY